MLLGVQSAGIEKVLDYNESHGDFPLAAGPLESFISKYLLFGVTWCFGGALFLVVAGSCV